MNTGLFCPVFPVGFSVLLTVQALTLVPVLHTGISRYFTVWFYRYTTVCKYTMRIRRLWPISSSLTEQILTIERASVPDANILRNVTTFLEERQNYLLNVFASFMFSFLPMIH